MCIKVEIHIMKLQSIERELNILDSIPNINRGGCGIAALAIFYILRKKNLLENAKIVFLTRCSYRHGDNKERLNNGQALGSTGHVIVKNGRQYMDSEGKYEHRLQGYYALSIPMDEQGEKAILRSLHSNNDHSNWNVLFNRKKYIPIIERELGISLGIV